MTYEEIEDLVDGILLSAAQEETTRTYTLEQTKQELGLS